MKEDILEQLVDEYLQHQGYFTQHNLKFKPEKSHADYDVRADAVASDIDVIGIHPLKTGPDRVMVVSCKSWQDGFRPQYLCNAIANNQKIGGREAWMAFRELVKPKWSAAFCAEIRRISGSEAFTYVTAVTRLAQHDRTCWEQHALFRENLGGNPVKLITFAEMLDKVWADLQTTPAASQLGRMLQLMKASQWRTA